MERNLFDLLRRDDGVVAVIFAVMAIPFIAMAGWAVDYLRIQHVKEYLQARTDAAALSAYVEGRSPDRQWSIVHSATMSEIALQYQGGWARDVEMTPFWNGTEGITVTASADVPLAFMKLIPGVPETQRVTVSAVVQFFVPKEIRVPPDTSLLDPEAGDYNRLWMYCFWPNRLHDDPDLPPRTRMVPVADNGGSTFTPDFSEPPTESGLVSVYNSIITSNALGLDGAEEGAWRVSSGAGTGTRTYEYMWPDCAPGSFLSFRLENVRFSRTQPQYWDAGAAPNRGGDGHTGRFDYYTDTFFEADSTTEQYADLTGPQEQPLDILETVLCDSIEQCRPVSEGGIIPEGRPRNPQRATGGCEPGKYMYYGWEDRPPGLPGRSDNWEYQAWTDRDYDDIRIIIKCPTFEMVGERNARLVG